MPTRPESDQPAPYAIPTSLTERIASAQRYGAKAAAVWISDIEALVAEIRRLEALLGAMSQKEAIREQE